MLSVELHQTGLFYPLDFPGKLGSEQRNEKKIQTSIKLCTNNVFTGVSVQQLTSCWVDSEQQFTTYL